MDARDYIRGTRPWSQFLNYCDTVANEEGGRLWTAQLSDRRHWDEIRERYEKQRKERGDGRPPLLGHSSTVKAIYMLANQIRMLLQAQGIEIDFIDGPAGPIELMAAEHQEQSLSLVDEALGYGKAI